MTVARKQKNAEQKQPQPTISQAEANLPSPGTELADALPGYAELLADLKEQIRTAQVRAATAANRELIGLYWQIGRAIVERQERDGWGSSVIDRLARDLQVAFPGVQGFSTTNITRMRAFYLAYTKGVANSAQAVPEMDGNNLPQAVAAIPWGHNVVLLGKLNEPAERLWYARQTVEQGWSRAVLVHQIESDLHGRQGKALTNFERTLPALQSDLAREVLKDPYNFQFLTLAAEARELDIQRGLLQRLRDFLIELGVGFAFVGSPYHLEVSGKDYYLDLLFYHLRLRCFVVIDLKSDEFAPEHAGKMNFYLSAVDDLLRHPADQPSIGLILCKEKDRLIVEYSLRDTSKPMGVASYQVRRGALPEGLRDSLPSVERLEAELGKADEAGSP